MIYTVHYPAPKSPSQIETSDEIIIATTPALRWAIGQHLGTFRHRCREVGAHLEIPLNQALSRSPNLGTAPTETKPPSERELTKMGLGDYEP